jgi:hypothetical protein
VTKTGGATSQHRLDCVFALPNSKKIKELFCNRLAVTMTFLGGWRSNTKLSEKTDT